MRCLCACWTFTTIIVCAYCAYCAHCAYEGKTGAGESVQALNLEQQPEKSLILDAIVHGGEISERWGGARMGFPERADAVFSCTELDWSGFFFLHNSAQTAIFIPLPWDR